MNILPPRQLAAWVALFAVISVTVSAEPVTSNRAPSALSNFIERSLKNHPDVLAAKADVLSAKAALRASDQAIYNPEIEFDYEETDVETKSIGISQTIDWGDQQGSRTAVAEAELQKILANYSMSTQAFINQMLSGMA